MKRKNGIIKIQRVSEEIINNIEIPKEGFLGLIAYGDIGILAWRKARELKIVKPSNTNISKEHKDNE